MENREPMRYNMVQNIAYSKVNGRVFYKCLIAGCPFLIPDKDIFIEHLQSLHNEQAWNGFCQMCIGFVCYKQQLSVYDEMNHMETTHIDRDYCTVFDLNN